ncbi:MAG: hypothetical protein ABSB50_13515 [Terracidiphilus sp.]|jgi:hypothetical protein
MDLVIVNVLEYSTAQMSTSVGGQMEHAVESNDTRQRGVAPHEIPAARIQEALAEILVSVPFRSSKQSQQLLQYIVDQTLSGHGQLLKERVIGADVFGRRPDYDTNSDPIVRARAAELRKRLAQFYVGAGANSAVRIEISPGSYHASFSSSPRPLATALESGNAETVHHLAPEPGAVHVAVPQISFPAEAIGSDIKPRQNWSLWVISILCALVLASTLFLFRATSPIDQFWKPILSTSKPVLIYTGSNPVYLPSAELLEKYRATHQLDELDAQGHEILIPLTPDQKFGAGDLAAVRDTFVTLGDVSANVAVATFLTRNKRSFDLRSGEDVVFGDLLQSPCVLIGAFNNGWTMQMTGDLGFVLGPGLTIRDRSDARRSWVPVYSSDNKLLVDYAIVARIPHSKTGEPLLAIAGITQSGTRAAAEFITRPQEIKELIRSAPKTWASENVEFVLQTKVVNDIPTAPTVVAVRYW